MKVSLSSAPLNRAQARMTCWSLTDTTAIASTPLFRIASWFSTKPGRWLLLQVGVNAPGTPNRTTFRSLKNASVDAASAPSAVTILSSVCGMLSPAAIVMWGVSWWWYVGPVAGRRAG